MTCFNFSEGPYKFQPLELRDLPWFLELRNSVRHYLHDPRAFSLEQAKQWMPQSETQYLIVSLEGNRIGYVRYRIRNQRTLEVGLDLHESVRGKGHAKGIYVSLARAAQHQFDVFVLRVLKLNTRARILYESLGFEYIDSLHGPNDLHMEMPTKKLALAH